MHSLLNSAQPHELGLGPKILPYEEPPMGCARLSTSNGTISLFSVNVGSFVLLKCVNLIRPAQPHCYICPPWKEEVLLLWFERGVCRQTVLHQLMGENSWLWGTEDHS